MVNDDALTIMATMQPFDPNKEKWKMYKCRIESFFRRIKINDENDKKNHLLDFIGVKAFEMLFNSCAPDEPGKKSYEELLQILELYYSTPVIIFHERKIFYDIRRKECETIKDFSIRVKSLASTCNFGNRLPEMIVDKFVTCMADKIFDRLCEEEGLTIDKAITIALKYEGREKTNNNQFDLNAMQHKSTRSFYTEKNQNHNNQRSTEKNGMQTTNRKPCKHCGFTNHLEVNCRYKNVTCNKCKRRGHMESVCRTSSRQQCNVVSHTSNENLELLDTNVNSKNEDIYSVQCFNVNKLMDIKLNILNRSLYFQADSGAGVSAIPANLFIKYFDKNLLTRDDTILKGYGGNILKVVGGFTPVISHNGVTRPFKFLIVENAQIPIVGRNFFKLFNIKQIFVNNVNVGTTKIESIVEHFDDLFSGEIGRLKNIKIKLDIDENVKPIFVKARSVPFAFRELIEKQLHELERNGIITKTDTTQWGTPLVPVLKEDGTVRICADYKVTINKFIKDTNYPIPRITDIFTRLKGCSLFSKIDMISAYNQLELDDESKHLVTWSTHIGNYTMNRLPFGVKPATGIFQREAEKVLKGIPGTIVFLDDILVGANNESEHNKRITLVFERLREAGLKLNKKKCVFARPQIEYLGHLISEKGLINLNKNESVLRAPIPQNVSEVRAFCGLVNYYGKFISGLATKLQPIYALLQKDTKFHWSESCQRSFDLLKQELASEHILVHYDENLPLNLTCDASSVGLGALISHTLPDGTERPIEYASRLLRDSEKNYSTIQKEALAIIYGTKKFFQYLIGRHFTLITDHKPLLGIFGENKGIPQMSASRLQRWAIHLSAFNYTIKHVKSENNSADMLSRLPIVAKNEFDDERDGAATYLHLVTNNDDVRLDRVTVQKESEKDKVLLELKEAIYSGKVQNLDKIKFGQFIAIQGELCVEDNIVMRGHRIIPPVSMREFILRETHRSHMGIVKTKSLLRSYVWWPNINKDIEILVKSCDACLSVRTNPPRVVNIPWEIPDRPWGRIHIDYAGPTFDKYFLIIVDAKTKWIEVFNTKSPTSLFTIRVLEQLCASYGLPDKIVSDNGTQFTSDAFKEFTKKNGINHTLTPPGYPATNGAAENAVKTIKNAMKKATFSKSETDIQVILNRFLTDYRSTPHCTTGDPPAKDFLGFIPKIKLDLLRPARDEIQSKETTKRCNENPKLTSTRKGKRRVIERSFKINDSVIVRNFTNPNHPSWDNAIVIKVLGPRTYLCALEKNKERSIKRHVNQMHLRITVDRPVHIEDINEGLNKSTTSEENKIVLENNNSHNYTVLFKQKVNKLPVLGTQNRDLNIDVINDDVVNESYDVNIDFNDNGQRLLRPRDMIEKPSRYKD